MTDYELDIAANIFKVTHYKRMCWRYVLDCLTDFDAKIICFGSTVKGTATPWSDIDIAYSVKDKSQQLEFRTAMTQAFLKYYEDDCTWLSLDVFCLDELDPECRLYKEITQTGVILKDFKGTFDPNAKVFPLRYRDGVLHIYGINTSADIPITIDDLSEFMANIRSIAHRYHVETTRPYPSSAIHYRDYLQVQNYARLGSGDNCEIYGVFSREDKNVLLLGILQPKKKLRTLRVIMDRRQFYIEE